METPSSFDTGTTNDDLFKNFKQFIDSFDHEHLLMDYKFMPGPEINSASAEQFLEAAAILLNNQNECKDNLLKEEGNSERKSKALKKLIEIRTIRKAVQDGTATPEEQEIYNELRKKYEDLDPDTLID